MNKVNWKNMGVVGVALVVGTLLYFPIMFFETAIVNSYSVSDERIWGPFIEEVLKFLPIIIVYFSFKRLKISPYILGIAVALGFGLIEDFAFLLGNATSTPFNRLLPLFMHLFFTVLATHSIVKCEKEGWDKAWRIIPAFLLLASLTHLAFNIIITVLQ